MALVFFFNETVLGTTVSDFWLLFVEKGVRTKSLHSPDNFLILYEKWIFFFFNLVEIRRDIKKKSTNAICVYTSNLSFKC